MKDDEKRSKHLNFRVSEETYDAIVDIAKKNNIPIATYVRVVLEEAIERDNDIERYGYDEY